MAKLRGDIKFTGSLGDFSAYIPDGSKDYILRMKGGPTREQVLYAPEFVNSRKTNEEMTGRSNTVKHIIATMHPLKIVQVANTWSCQLNQWLTPVQKLDTVSVKGQLNVALSKDPGSLEGFQLNKENTFDSVVLSPLKCEIDKEGLSANVTLPALVAGRNFSPPGTYPYCRWILTLGVVPDMYYQPGEYKTSNGYKPPMPVVYYGDPFPVNEGAPATTVNLQLPSGPGIDDFCVLVAVGISFGVSGRGTIKPVKRKGAGKVLAVK